MKMSIAIKPIETIEEGKVPNANPPFAIGLVKKSPKVAPKGLVKTNAIQNNKL